MIADTIESIDAQSPEDVGGLFGAEILLIAIYRAS
jgi:hypothetical protein